MLNGANVKSLDDSIIGSFGVYRYIFELVNSRHRNCEQATVTSHPEQFLIKIEEVTGPI